MHILSNPAILSIISVVIGSVITVIPSTINRMIESRTKISEENRNFKLGNYISLVNLITFTFKNPDNNEAMEQLRSQINIVNMIGSVEVVRKLDEYVKTWGCKSTKEEQSKKYRELLKEMRKDLRIDNGDVANFPEIALVDVMKSN